MKYFTYQPRHLRKIVNGKSVPKSKTELVVDFMDVDPDFADLITDVFSTDFTKAEILQEMKNRLITSEEHRERKKAKAEPENKSSTGQTSSEPLTEQMKKAKSQGLTPTPSPNRPPRTSSSSPPPQPDMSADGKQNTGPGTGKGLYGSEINEMMKPYVKKGFKGVYAADQLPQLAKTLTPADKKVSFIMNLDNSTEKGSHWVSIFIDKQKDKSLEYYDSFANEPTAQFMKDIHDVIEAIEPETYLKFKVNRIIEQSANSDNCGYFAARFIIDRLNHRPFKQCTKFNDVVNQEPLINKFKDKIIKFTDI